MIIKAILFVIKVYQKTLSPDHGPLKHLHPYGFCRFTPSCSEYARQSIEKHGLLKGGFYSVKRILRCNPWHNEFGPDPVPNTKRKKKNF